MLNHPGANHKESEVLGKMVDDVGPSENVFSSQWWIFAMSGIASILVYGL